MATPPCIEAGRNRFSDPAAAPPFPARPAEQSERGALAEILHDHLQPLLIAAQLTLAGNGREAPDARTWRRMSGKINQYLQAAIDTTRTLSVELNPPLVQERGLCAALRWHGRRMARTHGIKVGVTCDPAAEPANLEIRLLCFKAVRELLLNAVKHAGVGRVEIDVALDGADTLLITVADRGRGFVPDRAGAYPAAHGGSGLAGIRQRLRLIGGSLTVDSAPGRGTSVSLRVPL